MANLNTIKRPASLKESAKRVGRGQGSGKGKQSGRGGKGQTARAGNKRRPEMRDIIKKLPKRRGYGKNRGRTVVSGPDCIAISLTKLDRAFESGAEISKKSLFEKGLIGRKTRVMKLVGGETAKKFIVVGVPASASAKTALEKAGGSIK